jgi:hypothetical protein
VTNGVYTVGNQTIGGTKTFTSTIVGDISGNAGTATTANFATSAGSVTDGVYTVGNQTIGGIKTFTSTIVGDISGNAGTVTGGVYTTGNQTIGGTKTFSSTIVGDISGNAGTVTGGVYTTGNQTIGGTKTFTSTIVGDISGNAGTVTNGVYTTGDQTIGGTKTFSSTISGDISGNAGTVTNGVYTTGNQTIGGTKTFTLNPILSAGTANAILTLDGSKQVAATSGLTWDSTNRNLSLDILGNAFNLGPGPGTLATVAACTAIGRLALQINSTGVHNTALGSQALQNVTANGFNTAVGSEALKNTTGGNNTAVGYQSGGTGANHVALGAYAGGAFGGSNNIAIGYQAGYGPFGIAGNNNVILGGFSGNQHGIDIRTTSGNVIFADGAGIPRAFYNGSAETWDFRTGASPGTVRLTIGDSAVTVANVLSLAAGTALLPSLAGPTDPDTGMWFPAANTVAWSTGGLEAMRITSAGEVGIGTSTPTGFIPLTILANSSNAIALNIRGRSDGIGVLLFSDNSDVENGRLDFRTNYAEIKQARNAPLVFSTNGSEKMRINATGEVGIGKTAASGIALDVNGIIHGGERMQLTNGFANLSLRESATGPGYRWTLVSGTGTFRLQRTQNGLYSDATTPILMDASCVGLGSLNSQTWAFSNGSGGAAFSWNRSNGSAEMNIVNQYDNAALSFEFAQKTGASTASVLYSFGTSSHQWYVSGAEKMRIDSAGDVGINESDPDYRLDVNGTFGFTPGASVTPVDNGDVVFEATNNTTFTVKLKGSDGTVRTGTITLA